MPVCALWLFVTQIQFTLIHDILATRKHDTIVHYLDQEKTHKGNVDDIASLGKVSWNNVNYWVALKVNPSSSTARRVPEQRNGMLNPTVVCRSHICLTLPLKTKLNQNREKNNVKTK